jgi:membrane-associated HD superfamily phosphohydrolase
MEIEPQKRSLRETIALMVSNLGNPFNLLFLLTVYSCFQYLPLYRAIKIILIILFLALVPTGLFIVFNVKRGAYTNYDVSNQKQRTSLYLFSLCVIILIMGGLIYNKEPVFIIGGSLGAFTLLLLSFLVNLKLKCSLHTSFVLFIAISFLQLNIYWSLGLFIFSLIMAWSRLVLHRHTLQEVIAGAILGTSVGMAFHYIMVPYIKV